MDIQKLTKEQAVIITGFTGILCGSFGDFHADVEKRLGRGVQTFEMGMKSFMAEVKKLYEADFIEIATVCVDQAQAVPEDFVLVPKSEIGHYYYDESEGMYIDEPDHFLTDLDIGEAQEVKCRDYFDLPSKYAAKVWDEDNQDVGAWKFFDTEVEANNVATHCKAMIEVQEQSHD